MPESPRRIRAGAEGITPSARLADKLGAWVVGIGGVGVILVVLGIFVFVVRESYPLFLDPDVELSGQVAPPKTSDVMRLGVGPYRNAMFTVSEAGLAFQRLETGEPIEVASPPGLAGRRVLCASEFRDGWLALGLDSGAILVLRVEFEVSYPEGERFITPAVSQEALVAPEALASDPAVRLSYRNDGGGRALAAVETRAGRLLSIGFQQSRGLLGPGKTRAAAFDLTAELEGEVREVAGHAGEGVFADRVNDGDNGEAHREAHHHAVPLIVPGAGRVPQPDLEIAAEKEPFGEGTQRQRPPARQHRQRHQQE